MSEAVVDLSAGEPPAPRLRLPGEVVRVLGVLNRGGKIRGERTFPHPHRFTLVRQDGSSYAQKLAGATIDTLVRVGLVRATIFDFPACDTVEYAISERGIDALLAGGEV